MPRRHAALAVVLAVSFIVVACSGGSGSSPTTTDPAVARQLQSQLITAEEMGADWSVDTSPSDSSKPPCAVKAQIALQSAKAKEIAKAERAFQVKGKDVWVSQQLVRFSSMEGVSEAFRSALDGCHEMTIASGGQHVKVTVSRASFPPVAEPVVAYRLSAQIPAGGQTYDAGGYIVGGAKGNTFVTIVGFRIPPVDANALTPIVGRAFDKIS